MLIAAAWLLTFAFIINNYWSGSSTSNAAQKVIQKDINRKQKDIGAFCSDSVLIKKIASGKYNEEQLTAQVDKEYFIFFYKRFNSCFFFAEHFSNIFFRSGQKIIVVISNKK